MQQKRRDDGAAAVEFALVLPILAVLVFAILQFGFAFAQVLALNSAARQGARLAVTGGPTCAQVDADTRSAATSIGGTADMLVSMTNLVSISNPDGACTGAEKPCDGQRGEPFTVEVSKPFGIAVPFPFVDPSVTLTGKGEYRCESND